VSGAPALRFAHILSRTALSIPALSPSWKSASVYLSRLTRNAIWSCEAGTHSEIGLVGRHGKGIRAHAAVLADLEYLLLLLAHVLILGLVPLILEAVKYAAYRSRHVEGARTSSCLLQSANRTGHADINKDESTPTHKPPTPAALRPATYLDPHCRARRVPHSLRPYHPRGSQQPPCGHFDVPRFVGTPESEDATG